MNTKIYVGNQNKWIATDKNYRKVLHSHKNLDKLQSSLKKSKTKDAIIMFVPPFNSTIDSYVNFAKIKIENKEIVN